MRRRVRELIRSGAQQNTELRCAVECDGERHRIEWSPERGIRFLGHPGGLSQLEAELAQLDADRALAELSGVFAQVQAEGCCAVLLMLRQRAYGKAAQLDPGPRKLFARIRGMKLARERQRREDP